MKRTEQARSLLVGKFEAKFVDGALRHFLDATEKFEAQDWEGVAVKAGKFVESVTKCLLVHCGRSVADARRFKAGNELRQLESATSFPDTVRIVIPKACITIYEIVNNRGGRHDASDIDANEMDAKVLLPLSSWVLAELVRFSSSSADVQTASALISELSPGGRPTSSTCGGLKLLHP